MSIKRAAVNAAIKIQHFWQTKKCQQGLSSERNYDYYLQLLNAENQSDAYTQLASMMYGRVIATPEYNFPFLKQRNPFVGPKAGYHRNDVLGSDLTNIILRQWSITPDPGFIYIPVTNTQLGSIEQSLQALEWYHECDYTLIQPPLGQPHAALLQFIKIPRLTGAYSSLDNTFNYINRWGKVSSLGIIASPWVLSMVAIAGGFIPNPKGYNKTPPQSIKHSLSRQPKTIDALKTSSLIRRLQFLSKQTTSDASLLAEGLCSMIQDLPSDINAPEIIARLSLFIETALTFHGNDHVRFAHYFSAIMHELSLLLIQRQETSNNPLISIEEYQTMTQREINHWVNLGKDNYHFIALPAQSGSHANFIASLLAASMCPNTPPTIRRIGSEYWEVSHETRNYTLSGKTTQKNQSDIVRISVGPIGSYVAETHQAIDLNQLIEFELKSNCQLKIIIVDTTSACYQHLKLTQTSINALQDRGIALIFWESAQKFNLLHTDQVQYGRVFAFCHHQRCSHDMVYALKQKAAKDMLIPDVQIGAFINKNSQGILHQIKKKHFHNGHILRTILPSTYSPKVSNSWKFLEVTAQQDSFFSVASNFNDNQIKKTQTFFKALGLIRDSFGHRCTTGVPRSRISAGAENDVDITIFATSLKYYINHEQSEIYNKLYDLSQNLNIYDKDELITYLSLLKALHICITSTQDGDTSTISPMPPQMAYCLQTILIHREALKKNILKSSQQFITDIYQLCESYSPFKLMLTEIHQQKPINPYTLALFEALNNAFQKKGMFNIDDAIKRAIRKVEKIPFQQKIIDANIQEHKSKLLNGTYLKSFTEFFKQYSGQTTLRELREKKRVHFENQLKHALNELWISLETNEQSTQAFNEFEKSMHAATQLFFSSRAYLTKPNINNNYILFKSMCSHAIDKANNILMHHNGWKDFVAILALGIISLGIIPLGMLLHSKVCTGSFKLRIFDTDSISCLNTLREQITTLSPLPCSS